MKAQPRHRKGCRIIMFDTQLQPGEALQFVPLQGAVGPVRILGSLGPILDHHVLGQFTIPQLAASAANGLASNALLNHSRSVDFCNSLQQHVLHEEVELHLHALLKLPQELRELHKELTRQRQERDGQGTWIDLRDRKPWPPNPRRRRRRARSLRRTIPSPAPESPRRGNPDTAVGLGASASVPTITSTTGSMSMPGESPSRHLPFTIHVWLAHPCSGKGGGRPVIKVDGHFPGVNQRLTSRPWS